MKQILLIASLALLLPLAGWAQDSPKADIFGGYSYFRADANGEKLDMHGATAAFTYNFSNWFGVTGDVSGHVGSPFFGDVQNYLFMMGPRVSLRKYSSFTPFVHALVGAAYNRSSLSVAGTKFTNTDTTLAVAPGAGLDIKLGSSLSVRPFQADYVLTRFATATQNNFRLSTGIVVRLGNR